jgi:Na+/melibiose symporter-like transporter
MSPAFNSPASVTMLALIVALAVYLRQVSSTTQDRIEALLTSSADHVLWPRDERHTHDRIELLKNTRAIIERITPLVFATSVACALRVIVYAASSLPYYPSSWNGVFSWIDIALASFVCTLIVGMWIAHSALKRKEKSVRRRMYSFAESRMKAGVPKRRVAATRKSVTSKSATGL